MFRKIAAAVIAASLIAGPVFAQGTTTAPVTAGQPAVKANVKAKTTEVKVTETKKHVAMIRHHRRHFAHVKHVKHVKYATHGKHVKQLKQVKQPAKNKVTG
jgi:hypothetical protein